MFSRALVVRQPPKASLPAEWSHPGSYFPDSEEKTEVESHGFAYSLAGVRTFAESEHKRISSGQRVLKQPLPSPMQAKLVVGSANHPLEQEADRFAEQVMRAVGPASVNQQARSPRAGTAPERNPAECEGAEKPERKRSGGAVDWSSAPSIVHEVVNSAGSPLHPASRAFFEPRFGRDFSQVRIHSDGKAWESAEAVSARAYTIGQNIVFGAGQYAPGTDTGRRLLAHELAHVGQQGTGSTALQRKPKKEPEAGGDLKLPWKHGDYSLFEVTNSDIRFLVAVGNDQEKGIRAAIPAIAKQVAGDNSSIKDPSSRVAIVIITPTTTRFSLWNGKPVLALDPSDANRETAAHEIGHGIFYALKRQAESKEKDAAKAGTFRLAVADIYTSLSQTKEFSEGEESHPAGLWIADPSQWAPGTKKEHPWDDPDEFFASAKAGYQLNRKGLDSAIARFKKIDPKVEGPAKELLALLDAFFKGRDLPRRTMPEARSTAAKKELERESGVSKVEDTIISDTLLDWLLNPANRPQPQKAQPSIESPYR